MVEYSIHTTSLFDPIVKRFRRNLSVKVNPDTGLITRIFERDETQRPQGDKFPEGDIDLRGKFVLPGLVDAHTHVFLHSYDEADALKQKRDESMTERVVRAVNHCRTGLSAGYTTYRDLGSEGMHECDASLRDAINRGLTPGPRLFVATKVIASTGAYEARTENRGNGHCLPSSADAVDGVENCRQAVRRRIAAGADIIKFYADYRRRIMRCPPTQQHPYVPGILHPPREPNPDSLVFTQEEMNVIVREANMARCPVAAHAITLEAALAAVEAGVNTIEHGLNGSDELYKRMRERGVILVPTLTIVERVHTRTFPKITASIKRAYDLGVRIACGGDTGTFPHGENVRELEILVQAGIPVVDVLEACTVGGWEACGGDLCGRRFGWFEEGLQADIIATDESPEQNIKALRNISFVMKDAKVWKLAGQFTTLA